MARIPSSLIENQKQWFRDNPLKRWREGAELSMRKIASLLEVSTTALQFWEMGSSTPDREHMSRIAKLMGVKDTALMNAWSKWEARRPRPMR